MAGLDQASRRTDGTTSVGRYVLFREIASGGMATVYLGRMAGPAGFSRVVAIKKMHELYAAEPELVSMFIDEASLAARIQHPNVAATLDVVAKQREIFIVMDYVHGESLATLLRAARKRHEPVPVGVAASILCGVLAGLHAAHTARGEGGEPLHIVHRDVSPQNILVGPEGLARVVDFGVAKAASRVEDGGNADGRGKLGYTAPERLAKPPTCDARADIFAVAVIAWEMLAGRRLFTGTDERSLLADVLAGPIPSLASVRPDVSPALGKVLEKGLSRALDERWETAEAFARAIEEVVPVATARTVGAWVLSLVRETMEHRERLMREMEQAAKGKRSGSYGDAMSVEQLVEEIEAKSGAQLIPSTPPPARQSEPSVRSGELPETSGVRISRVSPGEITDGADEPLEDDRAVPRPGASRRTLALAAGGLLVAVTIAVMAFSGGAAPSVAPGAAGSLAATVAPLATAQASTPADPARSAEAVATATAVPTAQASVEPSATAEPATTAEPGATAKPGTTGAARGTPSPGSPGGSGRPGGVRPGTAPGGNAPGAARPGYIPDAP